MVTVHKLRIIINAKCVPGGKTICWLYNLLTVKTDCTDHTVYKVLCLYLNKLGWTMQAYQNHVDPKWEAPGTIRPRVRNRSQPSGLLWLYVIMKWYTYAQNTFPPRPRKSLKLHIDSMHVHTWRNRLTKSPFTEGKGHRIPVLLRGFQLCCKLLVLIASYKLTKWQQPEMLFVQNSRMSVHLGAKYYIMGYNGFDKTFPK